MSNRTRFWITLFLIAFSVYLLYPTYLWYFEVSSEDKYLLTLTPDVWADMKLSDEKIKSLQDLKKLRRKIINLGLDLKGGVYIVLKANFEKMGSNLTQEDKEDAINRVLTILRNRIDQFGVSEPQIKRMGKNYISIELPGAKDPERVQNIVMGQGKLTFQFVDEKTYEILKKTPNAFNENGDLVRKDIVPADSEIVYEYYKDKYGNYIRGNPTVLKKKVELDGTYITKVSVMQGQFGPEVTFILNSEGAARFAKLTSENVGKYLAIVLDGKVQEIARIKEAIPGGRVSITGQFTVEEANDLALILRAGSLPVPLAIVEKSEIGATLGKDSIEKGVRAGIISAIIVLLFMLIYYKVSGLLATILISLNLFFLIAFLASFSYTLTLPGIAGIILNIGMGVDAFVIIFERIKEEYKAGKSTRIAVESGFKKAFLTIFDANLTTLIAALALAQLGAGPIRGFAVTLSIGIIMNMLVALVTGRWLFSAVFSKEQQKLYI